MTTTEFLGDILICLGIVTIIVVAYARGVEKKDKIIKDYLKELDEKHIKNITHKPPAITAATPKPRSRTKPKAKRGKRVKR